MPCPRPSRIALKFGGSLVPRLMQIQSAISRFLMADARREPSQECCGLLAGRDGVITHAYPARNVASDSATQYEIAPEELFQLLRAIRNSGLTLLGIYHSHPHGANEPSRTDIARAYYPDAAYFIVSPQPDPEKPVRAFSIRDGVVSELQIKIADAT
jgi:proteasome lid subunit RPN8/RPN11